jgi:xanthine dehydrogenase accessory factor
VIDVFREVVSLLERGEQPALATLIIRKGSAPAALGAKMLVRRDGSTLGTIGGGCVEAEVWQAGKTALDSGESAILSFRLNPRDMAESGLICGGSVDILVEPVQSRHLPLYRALVEALAARGQGVLGTVLPPTITGQPAASPAALPDANAGAKFFVSAGDAVMGDFPAAAVLDLADEYLRLGVTKTAHIVEAELAGGRSTVLIEPLTRRSTLYVFGAGHLSQQLAPLAKRVHFRVVVIDDRAMFANSEVFPDADEVIVSEFEDAFDHLSIDGDSFLVILTRGHLHDGLVLEQALGTQPGYIGMIGSRTKIAAIYRELRTKGFSAEQLRPVHAPVGLPIGARLPEEIAVSILAELISVRNGRQGAAKRKRR